VAGQKSSKKTAAYGGRKGYPIIWTKEEPPGECVGAPAGKGPGKGGLKRERDRDPGRRDKE